MPSVLFVDDDTLLLKSLQRTLIREPYSKHFAESADEAIKIMSAGSIDVLVTDDHMPGMLGSELIAQTRERFPWVLPMLMTGQATVGSITLALNHGHLFRILLKPYRSEDLISAVRVALAHQAVLQRCREALPILRQMGSLLDAIDRAQPDAERLGGNDQGSGLDGTSVANLDELATDFDLELGRARGLLARFDHPALTRCPDGTGHYVR